MNQIKQIIYSTKNNLSKITKIIFGSLFIVFVYSYFIAEKSFVSDSKLFVYGDTSSVSELKSLALQYGVSLPGGGDKSNFDSPELFINLGKSREVLNQVLNGNFLLSNDEEIHLETYLAKGKKLPKQEILINFNSKIGISLDRRSGVISMSVSMNDPRLAMEVHKELIDIINGRFINIKKLQTTEKKEFIQERIKALEIDLNNSEKAIKEFEELNRLISSSPELKLKLNRLNRDNKVIEQIFILLKEQLESTKIEEIENAKPLIIIDSPNIPYKKSSPKTVYNLIYTFLVVSLISIYYFFVKEDEKKEDTDNRL